MKESHESAINWEARGSGGSLGTRGHGAKLTVNTNNQSVRPIEQLAPAKRGRRRSAELAGCGRQVESGLGKVDRKGAGAGGRTGGGEGVALGGPRVGGGWVGTPLDLGNGCTEPRPAQ